MANHGNSSGKKRLIRQYRKKFRTKENLNHYSEKDFRVAEKKYLKLCLNRGQC
jgi:hypothetical protein